jgi:hypothetical protein
MLIKVFAGLALMSAAWGQQIAPGTNPLLPRYQANFTTSGAGKVTVQATTSSDGVSFEEADIYCAAAQTATVYVNGTAATTTTLAVSGPMSVTSAAPPTAFSASNVGTGTTLKTFNIAAGATLTLDIHAFYLPPKSGTGANFTIGTSGTCTIQIQWVNQ